MPTVHPCHGLSKTTIDAFERIAVSMEPMCARSTIEALLNRGLIVRGSDRIVGADWHGPPVRVATYVVPIPIHMQWCEWCAENVDDPDEQDGRA